jgi:hypothetical protein
MFLHPQTPRAARQQKLGKARKLEAIRKFRDKEVRWMKDHNHKISRQSILRLPTVLALSAWKT